MFEILCLGDSLTEGYCDYGTVFYPYGENLQNLLDRNGKSANVTVKGVSGDRVVRGRFKSNLQRELDRVRKRGTMFDCVIIMGGINDVGYSETAKDIFLALVEIYEICFKAGVTHVVGCTLLEVGDGDEDEDFPSPFIATRKQVNTQIKNYTYTPSVPIAETPAATTPTFHALDTSTLFPLYSLSKEERVRLWSNDLLHLTKDGYAELGRVVFEGIQGIV